MTLTLDEVTVGACGEVWNETGVPVHFAETGEGDPVPGLCTFEADANEYGLEGVRLDPAHLVGDVGHVEGLDSIAFDIYINSGSSWARMYREGEEVYHHAISSPGHQMLWLPCLGGDTFVVSAQDAYVWEIRLEGENLVDTAALTFGCLKMIYRP